MRLEVIRITLQREEGGEMSNPFEEAVAAEEAECNRTMEQIEAGEKERQLALSPEEREAEERAAWEASEAALDGWIEASRRRGIFV
jgi:hypothetical protein